MTPLAAALLLSILAIGIAVAALVGVLLLAAGLLGSRR